jgi:Domain of unknown function (DUF6371)
MSTSIIDGFHAVQIDTKSYASGSHYVKCPVCGDERKKKNTKSLLINFTTGWYECFHCGEFKGFAQNAIKGDNKITYTPPPKMPQQFIPELEWNWVFADTMIFPEPAKASNPTSPSDVTWYYRNIQGKLTGAKRMAYNFGDEMKRDKEKLPLSIFTRDSGYYPCLFYEHDLALHPQATVVLVESEKTAALLRYKFKAHLDEFIYLATGGAQGLTDEKAQVLRGRNVWITYDCDQSENFNPDGSPKDIKGREGAKLANEKLSKIANPRIIDIDPAKTDGTDLGDLYRNITIQSIRDYGAIVPDDVKISWQQTMIIDKPQELPPLLSINGVPTLRIGNISLVIGKKKSRKTLFLVYEICEAIKQGVPAEEIAFFDTEQDGFDVWHIRDRVFRLSGQYISVFSLVNLSFINRKDLIHKTIQHWHKPMRLVFIDGIRDLMRDINDISETTDIIDWLLMLKATYRTHLQLVLHMNKTDDKARGHIGTERQNKCEITIELERDEQANCTKVKVESSRKKPFDNFAFTHSTDDLPEIVDAPISGKIMPADERQKRLAAIFENEALTQKELKTRVMAEFAIGHNKALQLIQEFVRNGHINKSGKTGAPGTMYKLATPAEAPPPYAPPEKEAQLTIEEQPLPDDCPFL